MLVHPHPGSFSQVIVETVTNTPPQNGHEVKDLMNSASRMDCPQCFGQFMGMLPDCGE